jgi:hypothetical protein
VHCVVCNRDETLRHRFWECPHAVRVWEVLRQHTGFSPSAPKVFH